MTTPPWPFSWPKAVSFYVTDGPPLKDGERHVERVHGVDFELRATGVGCDTGRLRYQVVCLDCLEALHLGTTGPSERILDHLKEWHP